MPEAWILEEESVHDGSEQCPNVDLDPSDNMQTLLEPIQVTSCVQPGMSSDTACLLTWIPMPRPANVWDQAEAATLFWWMRHLPQTPLKM